MNRLIVLVTFPNPNDPFTLKGGYKRVSSIIDCIYKHYKIDLVIAGKYRYDYTNNKCNKIFFSCSKSFLWRFFLTLKILRSISSRNDIIYVYNPTSQTLPALLLKLLFKRNVVVDYVDKQGLLKVEGLKFRTANLVSEYIFRIFCNRFFVSSASIKEYIKRVNKKAEIALLRGTFTPPKLYSPKYNYFNDTQKRRVKIFYLGALLDTSGIDILINAISQLENIFLFISGAGPEKHRLMEYAEMKNIKNVEFMYLSDAELYPYMKEMDILILPYLDKQRNNYNFPSKIIEYFWAGKPIIASRIKPLEGVLENKINGLFVPPGDIKQLRESIKYLASNPQLRKNLGENAYKTYANKFSENAVIEAFDRLHE